MKKTIIDFINRNYIEGHTIQIETSKHSIINLLKYVVKNTKEGITKNLANNYIEHIKQYGI